MSPEAGFTTGPEQIERYYRVLLSNASEGGRIELRAFYDDKRSGTFKRYPVTLNGAGIGRPVA